MACEVQTVKKGCSVINGARTVPKKSREDRGFEFLTGRRQTEWKDHSEKPRNSGMSQNVNVKYYLLVNGSGDYGSKF